MPLFDEKKKHIIYSPNGGVLILNSTSANRERGSTNMASWEPVNGLFEFRIVFFINAFVREQWFFYVLHRWIRRVLSWVIFFDGVDDKRAWLKRPSKEY